MSDTDAAGRLALFTDADNTAYLAVDALNVEGMTIDGYYENVKAAEGVSDVKLITVNGLNVVGFRNDATDSWSAVLVDTNSNIINFVLGPASEENSQLVFFAVVASIQPAE